MQRSHFHPSLKVFTATAALMAAMTLSANFAQAAKPKGAKPASGKAVVKAYAGNSTNWSSGAAVYWSPDGKQLVLWQNRDKSYGKYSVGVGKWTVDSRGVRCFQFTIHARKSGGSANETFPGKKQCREHVVTPDGEIWARDKQGDYKEWWKLPSKDDVKGWPAKSKFRSVAKQLGVTY